MNDDRLDIELKQLLKQGSSPVPTYVSDRVNKTLRSLDKRKPLKQKFLYFVTATAVVFFILAASSLLSSSIAQALSQAPFIGSVFQSIGNIGLKISDEKGLITKMSVTAEDKGISMTITDVLYDGIQLSIGYNLESDYDLRLANTRLAIDGQWIDSPGGGNTTLPDIDGDRYYGLIHYDVDQAFPDDFQLTLIVDSMEYWPTLSKGTPPDRIKGVWKFHLPVSKLQEGIIVKTFDEPLKADYKQTSLAVTKVTLTPAVTAIDLETVEPIAISKHFEDKGYQVYDDKGRRLEQFGGSSSSTQEKNAVIFMTKHRIRLAPLQEMPDFLVIRPYTYGTHSNESAPYVEINLNEAQTQLPLTLPQGDAGTLTVTKFEFLAEDTVIHYSIDGLDPYRQAYALALMDGDGNTIREKDLYPIQTSTDKENYAFSLHFPSSAAKKETKLIVFQLPAPNVTPELEIKIPLR